MIKQKKGKTVGIGIGTSSLMMIFTVLCLTVFATLSFLQANGALKRSEQYRNGVVAYYAADSEAIQIQASLEELVNQNVSSSQRAELLNQLEVIQDGNRYCYQVKISDTSYLKVELSTSDFSVLIWQMVSDIEDDYGNQGFDF